MNGAPEAAPGESTALPTVRLSPRRLAEFFMMSGSLTRSEGGFDRAAEGSRVHRMLQKSEGPGYRPEVPLKYSAELEGFLFKIEGRADGIFTDTDGTVTVDEIKTTTVPAGRITGCLSPCHSAQGKIYAAILCRRDGLERCRVRLTYYSVDSGAIRHFSEDFDAEALIEFLDGLLVRYLPWAKRDRRIREELCGAELRFPYDTLRPGQKAAETAVYRACCSGTELLLQAPTGIGKTLGVLYPSLRFMQREPSLRLLFLTARTTGHAAAEASLRLIANASGIPPLRAVTLTARSRLCIFSGAGAAGCLPEECPYAQGYYDRLPEVLASLLDREASYTEEDLRRFGTEYRLCPYELSFALAERCHILIGDYNYLFDPSVRPDLIEERRGKWLLLADEAHNLPDRCRHILSAELRRSSVSAASRSLKGRSPSLRRALGELSGIFKQLGTIVKGNASSPEPDETPEQQSLFDTAAEEGAAPTAGLREDVLFRYPDCVVLSAPPRLLTVPLPRLSETLSSWVQPHTDDPASEAVRELMLSVRELLRAVRAFDERYVCVLRSDGADLSVQLLCLDPAAHTAHCLSLCRSSVLFSATMTSAAFCRSEMGIPAAAAYALRSPFPPENLGIFCRTDISLRYRDRPRSIGPAAAAVRVFAAQNPGHNLVFCSSYAVLNNIAERYAEAGPEEDVLLQRPDLSEEDKAAFLARLADPHTPPVTAFAVLGGIFSEGIDLPGGALTGCVILGPGLPQVGAERESLRRYYDKKLGCGFDYAYRIPGMNRVLQAAGRVIRSETDRGAVLLIDDRFAQPQNRRLLPPHWEGIRFISSDAEQEAAFREFRQAESGPAADGRLS